MAVTMDMLQVLSLPAPKTPPPDGLKVTALSGPNGGPVQGSPALAIGGFTFWPMSYMDNRMSFGMVMYGPDWNVISTTEMTGARYIYRITLDGTGETGTVTFWGQADHQVQMPVSAFEPLMLVNAGK